MTDDPRAIEYRRRFWMTLKQMREATAEGRFVTDEKTYSRLCLKYAELTPEMTG